MDVRYSLSLPKFLAIKVQPDERQQGRAVDGRRDTEGHIVSTLRSEWHGVESDREGEDCGEERSFTNSWEKKQVYEVEGLEKREERT